MRIGVLTGGGDAPGLNAAIRAVVRRADEEGHQVSGVRNGWSGALDGTIEDLSPARVRPILPLAGTILGTSRANPLNDLPASREQVLGTLTSHGIEALIVMGGDATLLMAHKLHEAGFPAVGVPKTIDNYLAATDYCIGFDTAVAVVVESLDRLRATGSAHHRVMVAEVMGRDVGWIATVGGLAGGADVILVPEYPVGLDEVIARLRRREAAGEDGSVIVVAEGAAPGGLDLISGSAALAAGARAGAGAGMAARGVGEALGRALSDRAGLEARVTVLGHLQRGAAPSAADRFWATRLGARAAELAVRHLSGTIPVRHGDAVGVATLTEVLEEHRGVPKELYEMATAFS